ncbi:MULTISPECIES: hypothetical protein [Streptomyces]|uniref:hypothetical protein n=1 Tax=Streptomyces TaxID=1883 RepID=UPI001963C694|nr:MULTISPECIES: hypothetical protein [Streptomyces]QRX91342.1 hypothetical protein JNO44_11320 [Streptomyces noursei]UJB41118.1 hypothetical protein HRD51_10060 [Streptomyces sp. A1-5]
MFHSSAHPGRPDDRIWLETLRAFSRPVAVLVRPQPGWRRLVSQGSVDGFLQRLDLGYYEEHTMLVQVTTQRRLPEHVRVFSTLKPDALLGEFLFNSSPDGPIWLPNVLTTGTGQLVVDGTEVDAQAVTYGGYTATLAAIGDETVAVVSTAALHDQAVHLTFDTTAVPA